MKTPRNHRLLVLGLFLALLLPLKGQIPVGEPAPIPAASPAPAAAPPAPTPSSSPLPTPTPLQASRPTSAINQAATPVEDSRFPRGTLRFRLPLRSLIDMEGNITLRNDRSIYTLFVPIAARYQVLRCRLFLTYTNSISLLAHRSTMTISMNDAILAQQRLDPQFPTDTIVVDVPSRLLKNDFNRLQIAVAQRSTERCQDPNSPELFTQIDVDQSYFEAEMIAAPVPMRLSALRDIIDEKLWYPYPFHICLPDGTAREESVLSWGSIITQGIGLALGVQPFRVTHAKALRPGMDNIVVGTMNSLTPFLTATEIGAINGSFIAVKSMPDDPKHYMIIISGRSEEEVGQAALAFALINFPLPDSQFAQVNRLALPTKPAYIRNAPLREPGSYTFRRLGYRTRTIKGFNTGSYEIPIYMPGDLSRNDMSNIELRLNFTYGAAFRTDSTLNFFINQTFQQAIHLRQREGAFHTGHKIFLPTRAFQPGRNVIQISPAMIPSETGECELNQIENLLFTLYEDSSLVIPPLGRMAVLPSLGLLSQTGFPYTASPDGVDMSVFLTAREPDTVNAAWTLLGKIAQISGALLHRAELAYRYTRTPRNLLVVGPVASIPDDVVQGLPVSPREVGTYRYMVSTNPRPGSALPTGLEEFFNRLRGVEAEASVILEDPSVVEMDATARLEENIVMVQAESTVHRGFANTIVTAPDSARLLAGMNVLQQREFWNKLIGDVAVWNMEPDSLATAKVGSEFTYGATTLVSRATEGLGRQPIVFAVVILVLLAIVGFLARMVLNSRKRQMTNGTADKK